MSERERNLREYDHLNEGGIPIRMDIDALAKEIVGQNYGFVRMLVALCRHQNEKFQNPSPLATAIEQLIVDGGRY